MNIGHVTTGTHLRRAVDLSKDLRGPTILLGMKIQVFSSQILF